MVTNTLLQIAIMIFAGMLCGRLVKQVKLPNVTGYLIAGLLLGPTPVFFPLKPFPPKLF